MQVADRLGASCAPIRLASDRGPNRIDRDELLGHYSPRLDVDEPRFFDEFYTVRSHVS